MFEIVTTIALLIGLVVVNITKPGMGVNLPLGQGPEMTVRLRAPGVHSASAVSR